MIAPLVHYAIRGAIWYQGESNSGRAKQYRTLFPTMIADWRKGWGTGDFPFFFVQIAPHNGMSPEIREAQLLTSQKVPHTAIAVTTDVGNPKDIHPTQKEPVGHRLALAARALVYGEKVEYSGPVFDTLKVDGGKAVVKFKRAAGLTAKVFTRQVRAVSAEVPASLVRAFAQAQATGSPIGTLTTAEGRSCPTPEAAGPGSGTPIEQ